MLPRCYKFSATGGPHACALGLRGARVGRGPRRRATRAAGGPAAALVADLWAARGAASLAAVDEVVLVGGGLSNSARIIFARARLRRLRAIGWPS